GLPVVSDGRLVGILTNRDLRFERRLDKQVRDVMTSKVITARPGIDLEHAKELLQAHRIEKLPLVDDQNRLRGLITVKDMDKAIRHPHASKEQLGRLRGGAAVGVGPEREARVAALRRAGVDVICIDTAHGHTRNVIDAIKATKSEWPGVEVVAGNVATSEGGKALWDAKGACPIADRSRQISSSWSAACSRGWDISARRIWRSCASGRSSSRS